MRTHIRELLDKGLEHYGYGKYKEAIECWKQVLRIDPTNEEARDYLTSAGEPISELPPSHPPGKTVENMREAFNKGDFASACVLATMFTQPSIPTETHQIYVLSALNLIDYYLNNKKFREVRPVRTEKNADIENFVLTTQEAFILGLCDGQTTVEELKSLSQLNEMETTRALLRLKSMGLIKW